MAQAMGSIRDSQTLLGSPGPRLMYRLYPLSQAPTMRCDSLTQSDIVQGTRFGSLLSFTRRENERRAMHALVVISTCVLFLYFFYNNHISFSFTVLYIMTSRTSLQLYSRLHQFKSCKSMSQYQSVGDDDCYSRHQLYLSYQNLNN